MSGQLARGGSTKTMSSSDAHQRAENVLLQTILSLRGLHLLQAAVSTATAWRAYRRPRLAAATFVVSAGESLWYARRRGRRAASDDPAATWVDTAVGVGGLAALRAATSGSDCTTWMNWMCPINLGTVAGAATSLPRRDASLVLTAITGTWFFSVKRSIAGDPGVLATVVVSGLGYLAIFVAGDQFARHLRKSAIEIEQARRDAVERSERLAFESERERQRRLISSSALDALDFVANGWSLEADSEVRTRVRREAARLRSTLGTSSDDPDARLAVALRELAEDVTSDGVTIELLLNELDAEPSIACTIALTGATREALENVVRHAGVSRAVVRAHSTHEMVELTIRDHGVGCDGDQLLGDLVGDGGIATRIIGPIHGVGGVAELQSAPGRGMLVILRVARL